MADIFEELGRADLGRVLAICDKGSGLRAFIAIDDVTLGPACGGIRSIAYDSADDALADVARLSRAMTLKCAIAGLDAGGGKTVVMVHDGMNRAAAYRRLGEFIEDLRGLYRSAGDLGTTPEDLLQVAQGTSYVNTSGAQLAAATGEGIVNCIRACARDRGLDGLAGLRIAVQGCGLIGAGVARSVARHGATALVSDIDDDRARALAVEVGGEWLPQAEFMTAQVDILSPCAVGGVLTPEAVGSIRAWAICGGANNQLSQADVDDMLAEQGIAYVPDFLASSGAVIDGIARSVMQTDPATLIARLEETALCILQQARSEGRGTAAVGHQMARSRIETARAKAGSLS